MGLAQPVPFSSSYDAASRLTQVAQGALVVGIGYDNANRRMSLTYPNGTNTAYSYDNASRVTAITHNGPSGLIESLSYTYDAAGNRISLARTSGTATLLPQAVQAAYDAANEQSTFNSLPNTFDANGNQTTSTDASGTTTYTWDAKNRLVAQSGPGVNATFQYDALGRRISKIINGVTTSYLYDGNDIVQEIGGSAVGASYVRSLNIDEAFVRQMASGNEFYHTDALGSTLDLTNQAGAVQASYHYEAFGKATMTGSSSNPFQYTGRENDGTGIYMYRRRYYSPQSGRFLSSDIIGQKRGSNLYTYVSNAPTRYRDPLGRYKIDPSCHLYFPQLDEAIKAAQRGANACAKFPCDKKNMWNKQLSDPDFIIKCENCGGSRPAYGCTDQGTPTNPTKYIIIDPNASVLNIDCFAATVFHETLHTFDPDDSSVADQTQDCFGSCRLPN